ncbi:polysaccharide pyruvyl transferase family protein [Fusobacterium sp. PH5-44]|uniref:polysaccharide pyruvyl transferase family protein n=1 Tax=unclassified Fusobacterium TaxID=2648384 RepID=UPI003D25BDFF
MKICILGWYGTETIGDRAILGGILSLFGEIIKDDILDIKIGTLYPFYSERMKFEDLDLFEKISNKSIDIKLFNSKRKKELNDAIRQSDFIIFGGGPIMHIDPLYIIEYAFSYAKRLNKKTGIIGCGIGPLFYQEYKKSTINILKQSDIIILRDQKSKENLLNILDEFKLYEFFNFEKIKVSFDPAVKCAIEYMKYTKQKRKEEIVVNLRSFPSEYSRDINKAEIVNTNLKNFINELSLIFKENEILLLPMHYFSIGGDDRVFFNELKFKGNLPSNVKIQNRILTLEETMNSFFNAKFCIGMRFHSVVLQTILSRKNFILDYTEKNIGKISGFVNNIESENKFYSNRYINLQDEEKINVKKFMINTEDSFIYDENVINKKLNIYIDEIRRVIYEDITY